MTCQKIEIYEHQICKISLRILGQNIGDWLCYGSAIRKGYQDCLHFNVEADTEKNLFNITIPAIDIKSPALKFELHEYQIFLKNIFTRQEFAVLTGDIMVNKRTCTHDAQESVSSTPIELEATVSNNVLEVSVSIAGGLSAYEIAKLHGFSGTEEDWISELQGAADAANDAKQSRESAQESLTTTLQAQDKCQEEAQKSESFKNEALGYSQSAALSANNAQNFAETAQAAAEVVEQKRAEAEAAASAANSSKIAAENYENNAKESKEAAITSQLAAEQAALDAQIAQSISEEQARIATEAAAAAQAPESIAAQAARPATMILLKDELMGVLSNSGFHIDTDGQKIIVHTDRLDDEQLAEVEDILERYVPQFIEVARYNHHMEISWRDINKYATCVTYEDMVAVNPNYMDDLTSDGWWVYPLPKLKQFSPTFGTYATHLTTAQRRKFTHFVIDDDITRVLDGEGGSSWPRYTYAGFAQNSYLEEFRCITNGAERCQAMFHNCNRLSKYRGALLYCKKADSMFHGCVLDKDSVLHIGETLCDFAGTETNQITLGIHVDHEQDEEVLAALTQIEEKGWSVAAQYNGQSSSAASTLGWGRLIYARLNECELPDGSITRHLDWGHYVTHPEDYETFRSVEAAYEYFGLNLQDEKREI